MVQLVACLARAFQNADSRGTASLHPSTIAAGGGRLARGRAGALGRSLRTTRPRSGQAWPIPVVSREHPVARPGAAHQLPHPADDGQP